MKTKAEERLCKTCSQPLKGRSDKKYCDELCRNSYHNQHKTARPGCIRSINSRLLKNRQILEQLFLSQRGPVPRNHIERLGFLFPYHTDISVNRKGNIYYYCYDYGYIELTGMRVGVVRKKGEC